MQNGAVAADSNYGGRNAFGYCGNKGIVYLSGGIGIPNYNGGLITVATLPTGYRPNTNHYYLCPLMGTRVARAYIRPDGKINVEWIKNIEDASDYTGNVGWIDMTTFFPVSS